MQKIQRNKPEALSSTKETGIFLQWSAFTSYFCLRRCLCYLIAPLFLFLYFVEIHVAVWHLGCENTSNSSASLPVNTRKSSYIMVWSMRKLFKRPRWKLLDVCNQYYWISAKVLIGFYCVKLNLNSDYYSSVTYHAVSFTT